MRQLTHPQLVQIVTLETPLTRHAEHMQGALDKLLGDKQTGIHLQAENVRAAVMCGLLTGVRVEDVADWSPALTIWVSVQVTEAISAALEGPTPE